MPTLTWIQETADDRYYERHGGGSGGPPPPPVYPCVICGREFDSQDERSWHATEAHPMNRPTLYLGERAAPAELVIRTVLEPAELRVESCTSARVAVDGSALEDVDAGALGSLLEDLRSSHVAIQLENHRAVDEADVRASYALRIAVPSEDELAEVDRAFVRHLAIDRPSTREVEAFASKVESFVSARSYAGGLADYVHGVLVKEGSDFGGATLPFEAFEAKFTRALVELADHASRPVAASVVAATRLNLNELVSPVPESGDVRFDGCVRTLRGLVAPSAGGLDPVQRAGLATVALCPIDRDTNTIVAAHELLGRVGLDAVRSEELEDRADDASLSPQDRSKLRALIANAFVQSGNADGARRQLEALSHDGVFGEWATRELEAVA
jgi:hypothetical protein